MKVRNESTVPASEVEEGASGVTIQWLLDQQQGAQNFSMRRFVIDPGGFTPLHEHPWEHEVYILSGSGAVATTQGDVALEPGDAVLVEPNETHRFKATGEEPLTLLCLVPNGPATGH